MLTPLSAVGSLRTAGVARVFQFVVYWVSVSMYGIVRSMHE